jgi:hypothetical protein
MILSGVLFYGLICFLIGEFFGRAKHIGRWWTMFLFWSAPIPIIGLLALIFSPSAKQPSSSKGNNYLIGLGIIFLFLSLGFLINIFKSSGYVLHFAYIYFTAFIIHGIYFVLLGYGKISNSNPKFYFNHKRILSLTLHEAEKDLEIKEKKRTKNHDESFKNIRKKDDIALNNFIQENVDILELDKENVRELFNLGVLSAAELDSKIKLIENKKQEKIKEQKEKEELAIRNKEIEDLQEEILKSKKKLKSLLKDEIISLEEYNVKLKILDDKYLSNYKSFKDNITKTTFFYHEGEHQSTWDVFWGNHTVIPILFADQSPSKTYFIYLGKKSNKYFYPYPANYFASKEDCLLALYKSINYLL